MLNDLFKKKKYITVKNKTEEVDANIPEVHIPNGMWVKCKRCSQILYNNDLKAQHMVCNYCNEHFYISPKERIELIADEGSFQEINSFHKEINPLNFPGYVEKIKQQAENTDSVEAVITGKCKINGTDVVMAIMDSKFLMGSMGCEVGEKITRAVETASSENLPIIIFTASGGARMQEGIFSLMQMTKISAALKRHSNLGLLYITVLTNPTTGGVTASFAMLGDIILSEPGAIVGFAGKRVIQQTINQELPKEFQKAEFLLKHGFIDKIVDRKDMKELLSKILWLHRRKDGE